GESMDPADYLQASYYERWLWGAERRLEAKGTITPGEVEAMRVRVASGAGEPVRPADASELAAAAVAASAKGRRRWVSRSTRASRPAIASGYAACTRTGIRAARATYAGRAAASRGARG